MTLLYGEIVDVFMENKLPTAKVRVGCALQRVSLALVAEAHRGDTVLVCDGVAFEQNDTATKGFLCAWRFPAKCLRLGELETPQFDGKIFTANGGSSMPQ